MPALNSHASISYTSIFRVVLVILGLLFLYIIREVVALVFVSIVVAAALDPFVDYLQKHKVPRALSIIMIYLIILLVFSVVIVLLIPPVSEQIGQLARNLPAYYEKVALGFNSLRDGAGSDVPATLPQALSGLSTNLAGASSGLFSTLAGIFGGLISFLSMLVITFYLLVKDKGLKYFLHYLTPPQYRDYMRGLIDRIETKVGMWLRGQLILCLIVGSLVYLGLTILGVKYALLLGVIAALTEIIPYVGPFIGSLPGIFIAFSDSLTKVILVILVYFVVQQLENYILTPRIMQRSTGLNAVVVMIGILIGAKFGGIVGALLAVPVISIAEVILLDIFPYWRQSEDKKV